jgi:hypothetical protein
MILLDNFSKPLFQAHVAQSFLDGNPHSVACASVLPLPLIQKEFSIQAVQEQI